MRILFAALALPYPPMNGHRLRTWAMVRALAEEGHEITCVSFAEVEEMNADLRPLREICRHVDLIPTPVVPGLGALEPLQRLRGLVSPMPFGAWKFRSAAFTEALARHLARRAIDAVICDGVYNMQNLPSDVSVPVLLNKDDVAHLIIRRYLALEPSAVRRLYGELEIRKVERWERVSLSRAHTVLACSDFDRTMLRQLCPQAAIFVVPNVVDTDYYLPRPGGEPATVLFQGGMDWYPNRDAVDFFASRILPILRDLAPNVRFRVAGRSPSAEFRQRFADVAGLDFTGTVADMRDEIAKATVGVVPLRIGSGTRLKILEAGAMAKAVVSTTLGAEGLDMRHGEEIVIADEPRAFAEAVALLLRDDAQRQQLGRAARLSVEKHYSLAVFQAALRAAMTGSFR
jgi:glycosyltransferase involved in cell wall biosynthesis